MIAIANRISGPDVVPFKDDQEAASKQSYIMKIGRCQSCAVLSKITAREISLYDLTWSVMEPSSILLIQLEQTRLWAHWNKIKRVMNRHLRAYKVYSNSQWWFLNVQLLEVCELNNSIRTKLRNRKRLHQKLSKIIVLQGVVVNAERDRKIRMTTHQINLNQLQVWSRRVPEEAPITNWIIQRIKRRMLELARSLLAKRTLAAIHNL